MSPARPDTTAEVLAALQTMVRAFNVTRVDPLIAFVAIERARAAIARATGTTPTTPGKA